MFVIETLVRNVLAGLMIAVVLALYVYGNSPGYRATAVVVGTATPSQLIDLDALHAAATVANPSLRQSLNHAQRTQWRQPWTDPHPTLSVTGGDGLLHFTVLHREAAVAQQLAAGVAAAYSVRVKRWQEADRRRRAAQAQAALQSQRRESAGLLRDLWAEQKRLQNANATERSHEIATRISALQASLAAPAPTPEIAAGMVAWHHARLDQQAWPSPWPVLAVAVCCALCLVANAFRVRP